LEAKQEATQVRRCLALTFGAVDATWLSIEGGSVSDLFTDLAMEFAVIFGGLTVTTLAAITALWLNGAIGI